MDRAGTIGELHFDSMKDMLYWVQEAEAHIEASSSAKPLASPPGLQRQLQHRDDIDRAVSEGRVSRTQAKKLKKTIKRLQTEYIEAYEAGQDMEIWLQRVQVDDDNGTADILAFGDKLKAKPSKPDPALIGAPDQKYMRIRNGITMDSGCSVFVVPSDWLQMFHSKSQRDREMARRIPPQPRTASRSTMKAKSSSNSPRATARRRRSSAKSPR